VSSENQNIEDNDKEGSQSDREEIIVGNDNQPQTNI
jgi:hypothetical protein